MPEGEGPHGGKALGFLKNSTAGLPNWAWILVIGAGIAAAVIIPKFIQGQNSGNTGSNNPGSDTGPSGLGLAIDPTTGLPYAVEGLVPSGAMAGQTNLQAPPLQGANTSVSSSLSGNVRGSRLGDVYDTSLHPQGIPITSTPGGSENIGAIPFGTSGVQVISQAAQTGPTSPQGGSTYYLVNYNGTTGYVSSFDLPQLNQGVGSTGPQWPALFDRSRHPRMVQEIYHAR